MTKDMMKIRNKIAHSLQESGYSLSEIAKIFASLSTREGVRKAILKHKKQ